MGGAWLSGRLAGRIKPRHQIRHGFVIMLLASLVNVALNFVCRRRMPPGRSPPIAIFAFGWALMVPVVTLMVLDLAPDRRGMASSLQAFVGSVANGLVAGVHRAAGDALDARARAGVAGHARHRHRRLDLGEASFVDLTSPFTFIACLKSWFCVRFCTCIRLSGAPVSL